MNRCCRCKGSTTRRIPLCTDCLRAIRREIGNANATAPDCVDMIEAKWRQTWLGRPLRTGMREHSE